MKTMGRRDFFMEAVERPPEPSERVAWSRRPSSSDSMCGKLGLEEGTPGDRALVRS